MGASWPRSLAAGSVLLLVVQLMVVFSLGPTNPASAAGAPVTIGVICSCTGPLGPGIKVEPPGVQAWADYENAHGGLNGHPITVIVKDDLSDPGTATSYVQQLVTQDHITVLVDDSNVDTGFASYIDKQKVPVIGGGSDSDFFLSDSNWFAPGATVDSYFVAYMKAAQKLGVHTIGQLYCAESSICQQGVPSFRTNAKANHINVGVVDSISYAAPNYTAPCLAAKDAGVKLLNIADAQFVATKVASDCEAQGYTPSYVAGGAAIGNNFASLPGFQNHFIGFEEDVPYFATSVPGVKTYESAMKKYEPSTLTNTNYTEVVIQNWISGMLLAKAVQKANVSSGSPITTADVYKGLYALHGETLGGMTPPLTFKKGSPTTIHCWFWIKAENGKFTTPYGLSPSCATPAS